MCSNQLSYSGIRNSLFNRFGVQIYSKISFPQNYCTIFSQKMYLCKTDIHTHHDDTTTYLTHNLGPLRLDGAGARPVDFHPRFMGLRHDFRNRRPRKPHVHGREPLRQTRRNPRRGDHLRLHGARIHQTADPSERENDNQSNVRPDQPPRRLHQRAGRLLLRAAQDRNAHRARLRHSAHQNHRRALSGRCGRRSAACFDALHLLLYPRGTAGPVCHRLHQHVEPPGPSGTAFQGVERPARRRLSARTRPRPDRRNQPHVPQPGGRTPLRFAARRAGGAGRRPRQRNADRGPRHRHRQVPGRRPTDAESADNRKYY